MASPASVPAAPAVDPGEEREVLLRDLGSSSHGLSQREAERRLLQYGRNELVRRGSRRWPRELARQFTHPLALLLAAAALLAVAGGIVALAAAIAAVILLNALLAFFQERQAEAAVEALQDYLAPHAQLVRDGAHRLIEASALVPGDVMTIAEGDRVAADARLLDGSSRSTSRRSPASRSRPIALPSRRRPGRPCSSAATSSSAGRRARAVTPARSSSPPAC